MYWILLLLAGIFETLWAFFLGKQQYAFYIIAMFICMFFTSLASKGLPINIVYSTLIGIGTIGTTLFSVYIFKQPFSMWTLGFTILIFIGIVGIKFTP